MNLLNSSKNGPKNHPRSQFTANEDELLTNLVDHFGDDNWEDISSHMKNRNIRQCKERWFNYLSPKIKNSKWTPEEDTQLEKYYLKYGPKWVKIAHMFKGRTDINIKNRFLLLQRHKNKSLKKSNNKIGINTNDKCLNLNFVPTINDEIPKNEKCFSSVMEYLMDIPCDTLKEWNFFDLNLI